MKRRLSLSLAILGTILSVIAFAISFPPFNLRPLAFVCLVPLLLAIRSGGRSRALWLGGLWGLLAGWAIASVFPASLASYYERPPWFGFLAGNIVFIVMAAAYYAVFAGLDRVLARRVSALTPMLVAAAWIAVELARGRLFTGATFFGGTPFFIGNPWGLLGYTHASGALAQVASLAGVYGISFVIVAVNAGIAGLIGMRRNREARWRAIRGLALSVLPAIAAVAFGGSVLGSAPEPSSVPGLDPVVIVQGDVSIDRRWRSDFYAKNLDVYLRLTHDAVRTAPLMVVWPETAMNFFLEAEPRYQQQIAAALAGSDAWLLAGGPSGEGDKLPPFYNSVFAIDSAGDITGRYDKEYLVPFSEFFPAASLDWMQRVLEGARTFDHGPTSPPPLDTPVGRVGILICNEAMLPEVARDRVLRGADILVSPSNDSWIAGRAFSEHMLAVVSLRAVEQARYLIRASTSGPSAIVDPYGRVLVRTEPFQRQALHGRVRAEHTTTPYARFGDAFAAGCVLVALWAAFFHRRRRRPWRRRVRVTRDDGP